MDMVKIRFTEPNRFQEILVQKAQALIIEASGVPKASETLTKRVEYQKVPTAHFLKRHF